MESLRGGVWYVSINFRLNIYLLSYGVGTGGGKAPPPIFDLPMQNLDVASHQLTPCLYISHRSLSLPPPTPKKKNLFLHTSYVAIVMGMHSRWRQ